MSRPPILSDLDEKVCLDFDEAWRGHGVPDLADYWREGQPLALLAELVSIDMERQAKAGSSPRTAAYLRRLPALGTDREVALNLLQAEYGFRRPRDTALTSEVFAGEYPEFAEELRRRLGEAGTVTSLDTPGPEEAEAMRPMPRVPEIPGFRILQVLGQGGMGIVYEAVEETLRRRVALKVMRPEIAQDLDARKRFLREARTVARLNHDHVVAIHHVGEAGGRPFLTMPLLQGESLADRLARPPALTPRELATLGLQAARGLAAVHAAEMIHRDVKPGNLWLEKLPTGAENAETGEQAPSVSGDTIAWRVKLLDFGLVRTGEDSSMSSSSLVVGTPAYIAPEQVEGSEVTCQADVFSLGCTLYEAATGKRPFAGSTIMAQIVELTHHRPPAPREINPHLPEALSTLIERMLAKRPQDRPGTNEIAAVLQRMQRDEPPTGTVRRSPADALPDGAVSQASEQENVPLARSPRRRRLAAWAIPVLGLLGLLLAGIVLRFETPRGTLVLEIEDPEAEVLIQGQGVRLQTRDRRLDLKVGNYTIELVEGPSGLKLNTERFTIGEKGKEVRVWVERKPSQAIADGTSRAVKRILRHGGQVTCEVAGKGTFVVAEPNRLPLEPLTPVAVHLKAASPAAAKEASEALSALKGCPFLRLEGDAVDDAVLERLAAMPSSARLRELDLTGTMITPAGYMHLPNFKELTKFTHFHAKLDLPAMKCLGKLPALKFLNLHGCTIPDEAFAGLRGLDLGYLNLAANPRLTNAGLRHLASIRTLTSLNLSRAHIDDAGLEALAPLTALKELSLNETKVTATGLKFLRSMGELKSLKLQENPGIDAQALPALGAMKSLRHLYLRGSKLTVDDVRRLGAALPGCDIDLAAASPPALDATALEFDGKTYVEVPSLAPFAVLPPDQPITIEATVQMEDAKKYRKEYLVSIEGRFRLFRFLNFFGAEARNDIGEWRTPHAPLPVAKTYRLAGVHDGSLIHVFADGKRIRLEGCRTQPRKMDGAMKFLIGAHPNFEARHMFIGRLLEMRVSKKARYGKDYVPGPLVADDDTLALYRCDEGTGEVLRDSSGNGHHGRIVGGQWVSVKTPRSAPPPAAANVDAER